MYIDGVRGLNFSLCLHLYSFHVYKALVSLHICDYNEHSLFQHGKNMDEWFSTVKLI